MFELHLIPQRRYSGFVLLHTEMFHLEAEWHFYIVKYSSKSIKNSVFFLFWLQHAGL